ncbi:MAG TPA: hypothetical protein VMU59_08420 [Caulobacteraceae bacterium]|nr:hypothetical protein [Caulobacteraceae bacterium]
MSVTLFRSVSGQELALLEASGWRAFPPSLSGQPVFYATPDEAFARKVAADWKASNNYDGLGFVARFAIGDDFLAAYELAARGEGAAYAIPAADIAAFNTAIKGRIEIIGAYGVDGQRSDIMAIPEQ